MTFGSEDDGLQALWRDTPPVDAAAVRARLERTNLTHKRLNQVSFALGWIAAAGLAVAELAGAVDTGYLAPILVALGMAAAWFHYRRAKRHLQAAFSAEPKAMLAFAIGRSRAGLKLARMLYVGVPAGVVSGYALGAVAGGGLAWPDRPAEIAFIGGLVLICAGVSAGGVLLARWRKADIEELSRRTRNFDDAA
ncbi:MAG: hypothetical protein RKE49_13870 [Oceanicaulis sp.]